MCKYTLLGIHTSQAIGKQFKTPVVDFRVFLQLINTFRTSPRNLAEVITVKYLHMIDSTSCHKATLRQYEEGCLAFTEAVSLLASQPPLALLLLDPGLCAAAHAQARRQAFEQRVFGEDKENQAVENIKKFMQADSSQIADCSTSVSALNYEDMLVSLFVSDGDAARSNRLAMTKGGFSKCGLGVYQRSSKGPLFCTLILADKNVQRNKTEIPRDLLEESGASKL